jgi:hypothetical protein
MCQSGLVTINFFCLYALAKGHRMSECPITPRCRPKTAPGVIAIRIYAYDASYPLTLLFLLLICFAQNHIARLVPNLGVLSAGGTSRTQYDVKNEP